jgi:hypothetical protein
MAGVANGLRMSRLFKLLFLGPLALLVATLIAEIAARALEYAPSFKILWFINLRMFGIFQRSHAMLSASAAVDGFQLFAIALPIFALACLGLVARSRLPLAVATQLSAGFATFLVLSWQDTATTQASLGPIALPTGAGFYVLATIVGACLLSCVLSHAVYLLAVPEQFIGGGVDRPPRIQVMGGIRCLRADFRAMVGFEVGPGFCIASSKPARQNCLASKGRRTECLSTMRSLPGILKPRRKKWPAQSKKIVIETLVTMIRPSGCDGLMHHIGALESS